MSNGSGSRFGAYFFVIVGGLIASLCGVCTFSAVTAPPDEYGFNQLAWVVGGFPTLIGLALVWMGVRRLRRS